MKSYENGSTRAFVFILVGLGEWRLLKWFYPVIHSRIIVRKIHQFILKTTLIHAYFKFLKKTFINYPYVNTLWPNNLFKTHFDDKLNLPVKPDQSCNKFPITRILFLIYHISVISWWNYYGNSESCFKIIKRISIKSLEWSSNSTIFILLPLMPRAQRKWRKSENIQIFMVLCAMIHTINFVNGFPMLLYHF